MSFDELPPDSESPKRGESTPGSEQEASVQDAPPAGTTRRRHATKTGTDAASSAPDVEAKPARARRTSTKAPKLPEPESASAVDPAPTPALRAMTRPAG